MTTSVTTVRLAGDRKKAIEQVALAAGSKCGRILRVSDVVHFMIDRYANPETIEALANKYNKEDKISNKVNRCQKEYQRMCKLQR